MEMAADNDTIHRELFLQAHGMQMLWGRQASMQISMNIYETRQCDRFGVPAHILCGSDVCSCKVKTSGSVF